MRPKVVLYFNATLNHSNQIYCGLEILKNSGEITLTYKYDFGHYPINLTLLEIDGLRIFIDTNDSVRFDRKRYDNCDFFVKRMLTKEDAENYPKLIPYGLNYPVFSTNSYMRTVFLKNKKLLYFSMRYSRLFSHLLNINESIAYCDYKSFGGATNDNGKIIFSTRLWNPESGDADWKKAERKEMNSERIELVRALREKYQERFNGGVQDGEIAKQLCPDLILDKKSTDKRSYLSSLKKFSIGVCNKGLEDSIGWKFGEYIANSLAVVTNPIDRFVHHGNLADGHHYLTYHSFDECLAQVDRLVNDEALRLQISLNNKEYYDQYLHPAAKFREVFRLLGVTT